MADDYSEDVPATGVKGKSAKDVKSKAAPDKSKTAGAQDESLDLSLNIPADAEAIADKVKAMLADMRQQIKSESDGYYAKRDPSRAITRPKQIPEKQAELIDNTMAVLSELEKSTEEHVAKAVKTFRAQVRTPFCCALHLSSSDAAWLCVQCTRADAWDQRTTFQIQWTVFIWMRRS